MLYEELLASCKERFDSFFKNVGIFENQFLWDAFSMQCYSEMYTNNSYASIKTVKELKENIPELKDYCKKCGAFYIPARNRSIPKYDVILGKQHEEALMDFLSQKLNTTVERADLENRKLPDCRVLRKDGSVAALFEVKFHGAPFVCAWQKTGRFCYEGSATLDHKKIEKQLALIEEENITTPVFYVHWIEYPCLKGVFFETKEQVKAYIEKQHEVFNREAREGDQEKSEKARYLLKMYSPLLCLQDFETFVEELRSLL